MGIFAAVIGAAVLYFLAMLAYFFELASLRTASKEVETVLVGRGRRRCQPGRRGRHQETARSRRSEVAGRLGLVLTVFAVAVHFVALVARGLAADPNRVPWGNIYEFADLGHLRGRADLRAGHAARIDIEWLGPLVTTFVVAALMAAFLGLDDAVLPLPDALNSPWLVIQHGPRGVGGDLAGT